MASKSDFISKLISVEEENDTKKELLMIFNNLSHMTFRGVTTGKYYPKESEAAYYKMDYYPGRMNLRHKSLAWPHEERFDVTYNSNSNFNVSSLKVYVDGKIHKSLSENEISDFIDLVRFMIVYLFKDPRVALFASEAIREITSPSDYDKAYRTLLLDYSLPMSPATLAEFFIKHDELKMMRLRIFLGEAEITPQNTDVIFHYTR